MEKLHLLLGIGLGALAVLLFMGASSAQTPPPPVGDWVVGDDTYIGSTSVVLKNAKLVVSGTGNLTLNTVALQFDFTSALEGEIGITVKPGGRLSLDHCTITVSNAQRGVSRHYHFTVGGNLTMNDTRVSEAWGHYDPNLDARLGGLELRGANARISNSTIDNCSEMGLWIQDCSPEITDTKVLFNGWDGQKAVGIGTWNSSASILRCDISANTCFFNYSNINNYYYRLYGNWSETWGTGIAARFSSLTVKDCRILENGNVDKPFAQAYTAMAGPQRILVVEQVFLHGEGIIDAWSSSSYEGCEISGNGGKGAVLASSDTSFRRCNLTNNTNLGSNYWYVNAYTYDYYFYFYLYPAGRGIDSSGSAFTAEGCDIAWNGHWPAGSEGYQEYYYQSPSSPWVYLSVYHYNYSAQADSAGVYMEAGGLALEAGGMPRILNCTIWRNGHSGISALAVRSAEVSGCKVQKNGHSISDLDEAHGTGIQAWAGLGRSGRDLEGSGWLIKDCQVYDNSPAGTSMSGESFGIRLQVFETRIINCTVSRHDRGVVSRHASLDIERTTISSNTWSGLELEPASAELTCSTIQADRIAIQMAEGSELQARGCAISAMKLGTPHGNEYTALVALPRCSAWLEDCTLSGSRLLWLEDASRTDCVNTTVDIGRCQLFREAELTISWHADVSVAWQNGAPLDRCGLTITEQGASSPFIDVVLRNGEGLRADLLDRTYLGVASAPPKMNESGPWKFDAFRDGLNSSVIKDLHASAVIFLKLSDPSPPTVSITSPAGGALLNRTVVLCTASAQDADSGLLGVEYTFDGTSWFAAPGLDGFSVERSFSEGPCFFQVRAEDRAGLKRTASVTFTIDTTPPELRLLEPRPDLLTNGSSVMVIAEVGDAASAWVNGLPAQIDEQERVEVLVELGEGPNTLTVTARDAAGNLASLTSSAWRDSTPPSIVLLGPTEGLVTGKSLLRVHGLTEPGTTVKVNGVPAGGQDGYFALNATLVEGTNNFRLTAADPAGNTASLTVSVVLDQTPPQLMVVQPRDGFLTPSREVMISGTTDPGSSVIINGLAVTVTGSNFQATLQLAEGSNVVVVRALDAVGNAVEARVSVTVDTAPPALSIGTPAEGALLGTLNVTVTGTVEPGSRVSVNGGTAVLTGDSWRAVIAAAEGELTIAVTAWDRLNNSANATRRVIIDATPPVLTGLDPFGDRTRLSTDKDSLKLSGRTEPGSVVNVNNIIVKADAEGLFEVTVPLLEGKNHLLVSVTDPAGNTRTLELDAERTEKKAEEGVGGMMPLLMILVVVLAAAGFAAGLLVGRRKTAEPEPASTPQPVPEPARQAPAPPPVPPPVPLPVAPPEPIPPPGSPAPEPSAPAEGRPRPAPEAVRKPPPARKDEEFRP